MSEGDMLCGLEGDGTGSESCPMAGFGILLPRCQSLL